MTSGQFPVTTSLAEYLRYHLGLIGTKIGCGEVRDCDLKNLKTFEIVKGIVHPPHHFTRRRKTK